MGLSAREGYCSLIPVDSGAVFFEPVHSKDHRIVTECDELKGMYFKMFWAGLHDKTVE